MGYYWSMKVCASVCLCEILAGKSPLFNGVDDESFTPSQKLLNIYVLYMDPQQAANNVGANFSTIPLCGTVPQ